MVLHNVSISFNLEGTYLFLSFLSLNNEYKNVPKVKLLSLKTITTIFLKKML